MYNNTTEPHIVLCYIQITWHFERENITSLRLITTPVRYPGCLGTVMRTKGNVS